MGEAMSLDICELCGQSDTEIDIWRKILDQVPVPPATARLKNWDMFVSSKSYLRRQFV